MRRAGPGTLNGEGGREHGAGLVGATLAMGLVKDVFIATGQAERRSTAVESSVDCVPYRRYTSWLFLTQTLPETLPKVSAHLCMACNDKESRFNRAGAPPPGVW